MSQPSPGDGRRKRLVIYSRGALFRQIKFGRTAGATPDGITRRAFFAAV
jgi:hypothetical protein